MACGNRYGAPGDAACRHFVELTEPCLRCAQLVEINRKKAHEHDQHAELPQLDGAAFTLKG